jgi:hypothetical protein
MKKAIFLMLKWLEWLVLVHFFYEKITKKRFFSFVEILCLQSDSG